MPFLRPLLFRLGSLCFRLAGGNPRPLNSSDLSLLATCLFAGAMHGRRAGGGLAEVAVLRLAQRLGVLDEVLERTREAERLMAEMN